MLSKETILNNLPRTPMTHRRVLPSEQGVYFFIAQDQIYYIGASKNIRKRMANLCDHPLFWHLYRKAGNKIGEEFQAERAKTQEATTIAWLLLPVTRTDLFAIEQTLIKQHSPELNRAGLPLTHAASSKIIRAGDVTARRRLKG